MPINKQKLERHRRVLFVTSTLLALGITALLFVFDVPDGSFWSLPVIILAACWFLSTGCAFLFFVERDRRRKVASATNTYDDMLIEVKEYILSHPERRHVVVYRNDASMRELIRDIPATTTVFYLSKGVAYAGWHSDAPHTTLSCTTTLRNNGEYIQICHRLRNSTAQYFVRGYFTLDDLDVEYHPHLFKLGQKHHSFITTHE